MSAGIFPEDLPGLSIEMSCSPLWESTVHKSVAGVSLGATAYAAPLWKYRLKFDVLRAGAQQDLLSLYSFYNLCRGRADTFWFFDDENCVVVDESLAVGDGITTTYEFSRGWINSGQRERIFYVNTVDAIKVDGVLMTEGLEADYVITDVGDNDNRLEFTVPPPEGAVIDWSGSYYRKCRFDTDSIDFERIVYGLWKSGSIEFTTVKGNR